MLYKYNMGTKQFFFAAAFFSSVFVWPGPLFAQNSQNEITSSTQTAALSIKDNVQPSMELDGNAMNMLIPNKEKKKKKKNYKTNTPVPYSVRDGDSEPPEYGKLNLTGERLEFTSDEISSKPKIEHWDDFLPTKMADHTSHAPLGLKLRGVVEFDGTNTGGKGTRPGLGNRPGRGEGLKRGEKPKSDLSSHPRPDLSATPRPDLSAAPKPGERPKPNLITLDPVGRRKPRHIGRTRPQHMGGTGFNKNVAAKKLVYICQKDKSEKDALDYPKEKFLIVYMKCEEEEETLATK